MGVFNYSRFHYFDKNGNELILNHYPDVRFSIANPSHPEFPADYAFVNSTPDLDNIPGNSSIFPISTGMRFGLTDGTNKLDVSTYIKDSSASQEYIGDAAIWNAAGSQKFSIHEYQSSFGVQNYPDLLYNDTTDTVRSQFLNNLAIDTSVNFFPTYSFKSRMEFEKVSTGLIETQTVYVLVENEFADDNHGRKRYTTLREYIEFGNEFRAERNEIQEKIDHIENYCKPESARLEELIREYEERGIDVCDLVFQKDAVDMEINSEPDLIERRDELDKNISKCDDVAAYASRFRLFFFIDGRDQQDFRFFSTRYDELTWSDRSVIDFTKKFNIENSDNGYSVNIGFSGEFDGVYQQPMYVCLLDTQNTTNSEIGEAYPIGEIMLNAEAEGEDERYRTFFANFGIPDPKEYNDIFSDTDINDDLPDYVSINKKSKQLFLSYNEIFPYIGSYKALLNAIKYLGYDDIFFKEWYKEIGDSAMDDSGYTTYEISYGNDGNMNTIETLDVSERIHLRKMNWISMLYRLNQELNEPENKFGFPTAITNVENYNTDRLPKLISLKNWVDRYATGVNCRVIDISGEGLVFERYNLQKWGSYQQVLEYDNEKAISPVPVTTACTLEEGKAEIKVDIYTNDHIFTIGEFDDRTFRDFCDGYFDENKVYHNYFDGLEDNSNYRYFGKTFEMNDNINSFQLRVKGEHDTYRFDHSIVDSDCMSLIIDEDKILFDCTESDQYYKSTRFVKLPTIQIKKGVIKRYVKNSEPDGIYEYYANIHPTEDGNSYIVDASSNGTKKTYNTVTIPTFAPPSVKSGNLVPFTNDLYSDSTISITRSKYRTYEGNVSTENGSYGLRYCTDNINGIPCFKMLGYEEKYNIISQKNEGVAFNDLKHIPEITSGEGYEYFVEILEGRMVFNDTENDRTLTLNFSYNEETGHQNIYASTFSYSNQSTLCKYIIDGNDSSINRFEPNKAYSYFVNGYDNNPSDYIKYDIRKSITVNNTGVYTIAAALYDENNNIFAKTSDTKVNVLPPCADIKLYISERTSGKNTGKQGDNQGKAATLFNNFSSLLLGYEPKYRVVNRITDGKLNFAGTESSNDKVDTECVITMNNDIHDLATITSLSDRIDLSTYGSTSVFVKRSTHKSHLTAETSTNVDNCLGRQKGSIASDLVDCHGKFKSNVVKGTMFDAILYVYDDVKEKVVFGAFCVMIQNKAYGSSAYDQYSLMFINGSDQTAFSNYITTKDGHTVSKPRYSYYFVPRWALNIQDDSQTKSNNIKYNNEHDAITFSLNLSNYIYRYSASNENSAIFDENSSLYMYYTTSDSNNYFGEGVYKQIGNDSNILLKPYTSNVEYNSSLKKFVRGESDFSYPFVWIGPNSLEHERYVCKIIKDKSDVHDNFVTLNNSYSENKANIFVDYQHSVSFRDFDTDVANEIWKDSQSISGTFEYSVPVVTGSPNIYAAVTIPGKNPNVDYYKIDDFNDRELTVRWRLYKRIGLVDRNMVLECYNKVLSVKLPSKGMYDLELDVFDKQGNKYTRNMGSAISYR